MKTESEIGEKIRKKVQMITVVKKSTESSSSSSLQNDAHSVALAYLEKIALRC